jgi:hypothetical protein
MRSSEKPGGLSYKICRFTIWQAFGDVSISMMLEKPCGASAMRNPANHQELLLVRLRLDLAKVHTLTGIASHRGSRLQRLHSRPVPLDLWLREELDTIRLQAAVALPDSKILPTLKGRAHTETARKQ